MFDYEALETRALAHMVYQYGPRMKSVFVDREALCESSRRQAAYHFPVTRSGVLTSVPAHHWDPSPPLASMRRQTYGVHRSVAPWSMTCGRMRLLRRVPTMTLMQGRDTVTMGAMSPMRRTWASAASLSKSIETGEAPSL